MVAIPDPATAFNTNKPTRPNDVSCSGMFTRLTTVNENRTAPIKAPPSFLTEYFSVSGASKYALTVVSVAPVMAASTTNKAIVSLMISVVLKVYIKLW